MDGGARMTTVETERERAAATADIALSALGVGKRFRIPEERHSSVREHVVQPWRRRRSGWLTALHDVSFQVPRGSCVGIVGRNGSGKSTLLRCVAGIYVPDEGSVRVRGRLAAFIELGIGFDRELTARDNLITSGMLFGLRAADVRLRLDQILSYAELERFADVKLKNYSSGMAARLAFALTTHVDADVLLFDEAIAAGDLAFQEKSLSRMEQLRAEGRTLVIVSHDMGAIQTLCDHALLLERGTVIFEGDGAAVAERYDEVNLAERPGSETRRELRRRQRSLDLPAASYGDSHQRGPNDDLRDVGGADLGHAFRIAIRFAVVQYKLKYAGAALGYAWAVMRPLVTFGALYIVFTKVAHLDRGVPHYAQYLLSALVLWMFFLDATTNATFSLVRQAELLRKIAVPRAAVPLAVVLRALMDLGLNLLLIVLFLFISGITPRLEWFEIPVLIVGVAGLGTGFALLLSALYVRLRDVDQVWAVIGQILFFGSAILYAVSALPPAVRKPILLLNPLAAIFTQMRHALIDPRAPTAAMVAGGRLWLLLPLAVVAAVLAVGVAVFARVTSTAAEYL